MPKLIYSRQIALPAAQTQLTLDEAILMEKPLGFAAHLQLSSFDTAFQFQIDCAPDQIAAISSQSPLRFQIPLLKAQIDEGQEWLPVIHEPDGNKVVGYCSVVESQQQLRVVLTELPLSGETIFVDRLEEPWMPMGLREAVVKDWGVHYEDIAPGRLKAAKAIALFVPGYMGNTSWMVHGLYPYLSDELDQYHTLLVFNYDWLGSPVEDMAQLMAAQLLEAGLVDAHSKVDIFAYSLGCLVARAAVEIAGIAELTRNVVLLGSPSAGTPLASIPRQVPQFASNMLGHLKTLSLARDMQRFAQQIYSHLESLGDLEPDSVLMQRLREATHPQDVRYLVVAGDNNADAAQLGLLARLVTKAIDHSLDYFFEGQNDGVVAVESALYLHAHEPAGLIERQIVPCNHYGFFDDEATRAAIEAFLTRQRGG